MISSFGVGVTICEVVQITSGRWGVGESSTPVLRISLTTPTAELSGISFQELQREAKAWLPLSKLFPDTPLEFS
jgi:hypothetical protein